MSKINERNDVFVCGVKHASDTGEVPKV